MATDAAPAWSLRRRLLAAIIAASSVLWLASLGIVTVIAWHETTEVFDDALEESGYMIMAATTDWDERGLLSELRPDSRARKVDMQYQIVVNGRVIQHTGGAPAHPFINGFSKHDGFADAEADDRRWRVFVVRNQQRNVEVQVGQKYTKRLDILEELAEHLWLPVAGMLVLLAVVCWLLTGRVLRPLRQTAAAIAAKTPDDLTLVPAAGQPNELRPIVQALNGVLGRLDHALQAERRFTADAAHELRTPLAGLHMHVQLLQRQHPALAAPFQKLRQDIGRSTALVDSLLTLARLDPLAREELIREPVALAPLLTRLRTAHAAEATQRGITLEAHCALEQVQAHPVLLDIALRNLVENALRYCPDGSRIEIQAGWHHDQARITVRDNGPGVDATSIQRLTERFFRMLGQDASGSGLGLSIVKRIADLHGMTLHFGPGLDGRGLAVTLDLPSA